MKKNKVNRLWPLIILVTSYGYIFFHVLHLDWGKETLSLTKDLKLLPFIIIQSILFIANLSCESWKWKILITPVEKVSLFKSLKMVLAGFTSGIFTPGKLGEPIGRNIFIEQKRGIEVAALNYYGGIIQNSIIFVAGITATSILYINSDLQWSKDIIYYAFIFLIITIILSILLYIYKQLLKSFLSRLKIKNKADLIKNTIKCLSFTQTIKVILSSLFRYCIYSSQLITLFYSLSDSPFSSNMFLYIPIYYMGISLIPSFVFADLGIRNSIALFLFSNLNISNVIIMICVSTLWVINQGIPAITGSFFFYRKSSF